MISRPQYTYTGRPFRFVWMAFIWSVENAFFKKTKKKHFVYDHTQLKVTCLLCMQHTRQRQQKNTQPLIEIAHLSLRCVPISGPFGMCHKSIHFPGLIRLTAAALCSATNEGEIVIINIQIYCLSLSWSPTGGMLSDLFSLPLALHL